MAKGEDNTFVAVVNDTDPKNGTTVNSRRIGIIQKSLILYPTSYNFLFLARYKAQACKNAKSLNAPKIAKTEPTTLKVI